MPLEAGQRLPKDGQCGGQNSASEVLPAIEAPWKEQRTAGSTTWRGEELDLVLGEPHVVQAVVALGQLPKAVICCVYPY